VGVDERSELPCRFPLLWGFILWWSKEARYKKTTYRIFSKTSRQKIAKAILEKRSNECHARHCIQGGRVKSERKSWPQAMQAPGRDDGWLVPFWHPSVTRGGGLKVPFFQKNWISNFYYLIQRGTFRPPSSETDKKWGWKKGVSFRVDFPLFGGFILSRSKEARYKKTTYRIFSENSRQKIAKAILEKRSNECHTGRWIRGRRAKSERKSWSQAMQAPGRDDGWLVPFWHPSVTRGGGLKVPFFQKNWISNFCYLIQRGTFRPPSSEMDKKWGWKKGVSFRVDFPLFGGFILSWSDQLRYKKTT